MKANKSVIIVAISTIIFGVIAACVKTGIDSIIMLMEEKSSLYMCSQFLQKSDCRSVGKENSR